MKNMTVPAEQLAEKVGKVVGLDLSMHIIRLELMMEQGQVRLMAIFDLSPDQVEELMK